MLFSHCGTCPVALIYSFLFFLTLLQTQIDDPSESLFRINRKWTATDQCGYSLTTEYTFLVVDNEAPTLEKHGDDSADPDYFENITAQCHYDFGDCEVFGVDNCDTDMEITHVDADIPGDCEFDHTYLRTYTVVDHAGHSSSRTQIVTIDDDTKPVFHNLPTPPAGVVECDAVPAHNAHLVSASDNCDSDVEVTFTSKSRSVAGYSPACLFEIVNEWKAEDSCGNDIVETQVVTVSDTTAPVIKELANTTLECGVDTMAVCVPEVSDNCGNATLTYTIDRTQGSCGGNYDDVITYTAVDECGLSSTTTETVTIQDTTAPHVVGPFAHVLTVECGSVPPPSVFFADDCSENVTVVYSEVNMTTSINTWTITRTWVATDECGQVNTVTQNVQVEDTIAPELVANDFTKHHSFCCSWFDDRKNDFVNALSEVAYADSCCETDIEVTESVQLGNCTHNYNVTLNVVATDCHGNTHTDQVILTSEDTEAPYFTVLPNDTILEECNSTYAEEYPQAEDNCAVIVVPAASKTVVETTDCYTITEEVWEVEDDCGNTANTSRLVTVQDTTAPEVISFPNWTEPVECNNVPDGDVIFDDCNIDDYNVTRVEREVAIAGQCEHDYEIHIDWYVDACGGNVSHSEVLVVEDTTPPEFTITKAGVEYTVDEFNSSIGLNQIIEGDCDVADPVLEVTADDNCDYNVTVTVNVTTTPMSCPKTKVIRHEYRAEDSCGNVNSFTVLFTYVDTTPPVLQGLPDNLVFECATDVPAPVNVTAIDMCAYVNVTVSDSEGPKRCPNDYVVSRTYSAIDCAGNPVSHTQTITIKDTTKPQIFFDGYYNASEIEIIFGEWVGGVYIREVPSVTCIDPSNASTCWNDTAFEEFSNRTWLHMSPITNYAHSEHNTDLCAYNNPFPRAYGEDNCYGDVNMAFAEELYNNVSHFDFSVKRTWTVTDVCGNENSTVQNYHFDDEDKPLITFNDTVYVDCADTYTPIFDHEDCDAEPFTALTSTVAYPDCPYLAHTTYNYQVIDHNGNEHTESTLVIQIDETPPVITANATWHVVDCFELVEPIALVDDCDPSITLSFIEEWYPKDDDSTWPGLAYFMTTYSHLLPHLEWINGSLTEPAFTNVTEMYVLSVTVRTYTTSKDCSDLDTQAFEIIFEIDDEPPGLIGVPADYAGQCIEEVPADDAIVYMYDNCVTAPVVQVNDVSLGSCGDEATIVRSWSVTDGSGVVTTQTQTIVIKDDTPPQIVEPLPPAEIYFLYNQSYTEITVPDLGDQLNVTENCIEYEIECIPDELIEGSIYNNYTLYRSCCAVDECGNSNCIDQHVYVNTSDPYTPPPPVCIEDGAPNVTWPQYSIRENFIQTINYNQNITCPNDYLLDRLFETWNEDGSYLSYDYLFNYMDVANTDIEVEDFADSVNVSCGAVPGVNISADFFQTICNTTLFINTTDVYYDASPEQLEQGIYRIFEREFTAYDTCGNTATLTRTYNLIDNSPPQIFNVTAGNLFFHAGTEIPDPPQAYADDDCETVKPVYEETLTAGNCTHNFTLTRVWTNTDLVGNTVVVVQELTSADVTPPSLYPMPSNLTTTADNIPIAPVVNATDDLDGEVVAYYTQYILEEGCYVYPDCSLVNYTIVRNWWAVDECGNEMDISIYIDIIPPIPPPEITIPPNVTFECSDLLTYDSVESVAEDLETTFNATVVFNTVTYPGDCPNEYTVVRTWTVTFSDGQISSGSQHISVVDTTGPTFDPNTPTAIVEECGEDMGVDVIIVTDNCYNETEDGDNGLIVYVSSEVELPTNISGAVSLVRVYTAVDECGNSVDFTQSVLILDTKPPYFTDILPENSTWPCENEGLPVFPDIGGDDLCSDELYLDAYENITDYGCGPEYTVKRTWRYTDMAGLSVEHTQLIQVTDDQAPHFISIPEDEEADCVDIPPFPTVEALDNCDTSVGVTYSQVVHEPNTTTHTFLIVRTWHTQDLCGNVNTTSQTITVTDHGLPVINQVMQNVTVECFDALPGPYELSAWDECWGDTMVVVNSTLIEDGLCSNNVAYNYTYTATDRAGVTTVEWHIIQAADSNPPVILGLPPSMDYVMEIECGFMPEPQDYVAVDDCWGDAYNGEGSFVGVVFNETFHYPDGKLYEYYVNRTWSADDGCGNVAEYVEQYHVLDTLPPFIEPVDNDTRPCNDIPDMQPRNGTDLCEGVIVAVMSEEIHPRDCPLAYQIERTWTVTDEQGHNHSTTQWIDVMDSGEEGLPYFTSDLPETPLTFNATKYIPPASSYNVTGADNCHGVEIVVTNRTLPSECPTEYTLIRTWTIYDVCGNFTSHDQWIYVVDSEYPVFNNTPGDYNVTCPSDVLPAETVGAFDGSDLEYELNVSYSTTTEVVCEDQMIITRVWTAVDCANHAINHVQVINVTGHEYPMFVNNTLPPRETAECGSSVNWTTIEAESYCGNTASVSQAESAQYVDPALNSTDPQYLYSVDRTWTATDACALTTDFTQTIDFYDTFPPTISNTQNHTIFCYDQVPSTEAQAYDICDDDTPVVATDDYIAETCEDEYVINRTVTACDDSGNCAEATEIIVVERVEPYLSHVPSNTSVDVECGDIPLPANNVKSNFPCEPTRSTTPGFYQTVFNRTGHELFPTGEYANTSLDDVYVDLNVVLFGQIGNGTTIYRQWIAIDGCGDVATFNQTLHITDTLPPFIIEPPGGKTQEAHCDLIPKSFNVTAYDKCHGDITVTIDFNSTFTPGTCDDQYNITNTFTATDPDGNIGTYTNTIVIDDTIGPKITLSHGNDTAYCVPPPPPNGTATDKCVLTEIAVTMDEEIVPIEGSSDYEIWRTFWATDACGNPSSVLQITTVIDNLAPVALTNATNHNDVEAIGLFPDPALIDYIDFEDCPNRNYSQETNITIVNGTCLYEYTWIITTTATDSNDQSTSVTQTISVVDTTPPIFVNLPEDMNRTLEFQDDWTWDGDHILADEADLVYAVDTFGDIINITYDDAVFDSDGNEITMAEALAGHVFTIQRTFYAQDKCGNVNSVIQLINVIDTIPPTPNIVAENITVECDSIPPPCVVYTIGENFDVEFRTESVDDDLTDGLDVDLIINYWWAVDQAGNVWNHTQYITIVDSTPPVFSHELVNTTHECLCEEHTPVISALDNCDDSVEIVESVTTDYPDPQNPTDHIITTTFTATDASGNTAVEVVTQTVQDTTPPVLTTAEPFENDITAECVAPEALPVYAYDECVGQRNVTMTETVVSTECTHRMQLMREWTSSDDNGNLHTATRNVLVGDASAPHAGPASHLSSCAFALDQSNDNTWAMVPDVLDRFDFVDNCDSDLQMQVVQCNSTQSAGNVGDFDANCRVLEDPVTGKPALFVNTATNGEENVVYSVMASAVDDCGSSATEKLLVTVPKDLPAWAENGQRCVSPTLTELPNWN